MSNFLISANKSAKKFQSLDPPFRGGEWFLADIEIALSQFVWDKNSKIV